MCVPRLEPGNEGQRDLGMFNIFGLLIAMIPVLVAVLAIGVSAGFITAAVIARITGASESWVCCMALPVVGVVVAFGAWGLCCVFVLEMLFGWR